MVDYQAILREVRESGIMRGVWASYVSGSPYVAGLEFEDVVDSAAELASFAGLEELN